MARILENNYPEAKDCVPRQMSLRDQLKQRLQIREAEVAEIRVALQMLDSMPDLERFHDVITRIG